MRSPNRFLFYKKLSAVEQSVYFDCSNEGKSVYNWISRYDPPGRSKVFALSTGYHPFYFIFYVLRSTTAYVIPDPIFSFHLDNG